MKGAMADPSAKIISALNISRIAKIGASQNFFLTLRKSQNSNITEVLFIFSLKVHFKRSNQASN
tara:strand:+ start:31986 stop:32177 length:192 start_codon:yes stop_codon:yes gene_type:complete